MLATASELQDDDAAMRNDPYTGIIMLADDERSEPDLGANINFGPEQPVQKVTFGPADHTDPHDRIAIFSDQLVNLFGVDACAVIERQFDAAGDIDGAATWTAIWDRLCGPQARHA